MRTAAIAAELEHQPSKAKRPYRFVVLRKTVMAERGQQCLSVNFRYFFYVTNDWERTAEQVVREANDRCNQENLIEQLKNGVRVEVADGVAARAGLREGDVILSLDNTEITSARQFESVVAKLDKSRAVTALVRRGDTVNFLIIRPSR